MKPKTDGVQDFVDRALAKRVKAGIPKNEIGSPALGRIVRISNHVLELGQKQAADFGLTLLSHGILLNLKLQGEPFQLSPKALAEALFVTSGGMSNALERLEKDELVERRPDPDDRRGVLVTLTPKGAELVARVQPSIGAFQNELIHELDTEEVQFLNDILRKLLVSLERRDDV